MQSVTPTWFLSALASNSLGLHRKPNDILEWLADHSWVKHDIAVCGSCNKGIALVTWTDSYGDSDYWTVTALETSDDSSKPNGINYYPAASTIAYVSGKLRQRKAVNDKQRMTAALCDAVVMHDCDRN